MYVLAYECSHACLVVNSLSESCVLIVGAPVYVYELCIDPRAFGCKVMHGHTSVYECADR